MKFVIIFLSFVYLLVNDSISQCSIINSAFKNNETIDYEVVYNWGFIWISAGKVSFSVKSNQYNGQPVYQIDATGASYKGYDLFFKVRDYFHAYIDTTTLMPLWAQRNSSEGSFSAFENYTFNEPSKKVYMGIRTSKKPFYLDTLQMKGCVYDILTAAFHARNVDYSTMKLNDKFPLWTLIDGKVYPIYIRYIGKEIIRGEDKQKYNCIKLSSAMVEGTIFKRGEELFIWITDDNNHLPILVEAQILVGSVKALFKKGENLRNPFTSKIK